MVTRGHIISPRSLAWVFISIKIDLHRYDTGTQRSVKGVIHATRPIVRDIPDRPFQVGSTSLGQLFRPEEVRLSLNERIVCRGVMIAPNFPGHYCKS